MISTMKLNAKFYFPMKTQDLIFAIIFYLFALVALYAVCVGYLWHLLTLALCTILGASAHYEYKHINNNQ